MNSDDRKLISKWLGYHEDKLDNGYYCPDEDYNQFKKIWNNLSEKQKFEVVDDIDQYGPAIIDCLLNDLPRVLIAVIVVIREE